MEDILEIVKSLEDSGLLLKGIRETIKNEAKEQKGGFLSMLLGTLGANLLGNMLAGKGVIRAGEGTARVDYASKRYSLKDLPFKKKIDSTTSFNKLFHLDEYSDIETHWIVLYVNNKTVAYFDSFRLNIFQK